MPNIGFKLGAQSALDALTSEKIVAGCFYLTSDTNRLYIGKEGSNGNIIEAVNQGITFVTTLEDLPEDAKAGQFYYITNSNILCVRNSDNSGKSHWIQINPMSEVTGLTNSIETVENGVKVTTTLKQNHATTEQLATDITFSPAPPSEAGMGKSEILINYEDNVISFDVDAYTTSRVDELIVDAKGDVTEYIDNATGEIRSDITGINGKYNELATTVDGHTTNLSTIESNLSTLEDRLAVAEGQLGLGGDESSGTESLTVRVGTLETDVNTLKIKTETNTSSIDGINGNITALQTKDGELSEALASLEGDLASLEGDLKGEITTQLKNYNAMVYKGTIGPNGTVEELPKDKVRIGDAYLALSGFNNNVDAGTLIIATTAEGVTEDNDGYIPADGIEWTYVTGSQVDTQYKGVATENGIKIVKLEDPNTVIAEFSIQSASNNIAINATPNASGDAQQFVVNLVWDTFE